MINKRNTIIVSIVIFSLIVGVCVYQFMFPKQEYAVSTSDPRATKVGMEILNKVVQQLMRLLPFPIRLVLWNRTDQDLGEAVEC